MLPEPKVLAVQGPRQAPDRSQTAIKVAVLRTQAVDIGRDLSRIRARRIARHSPIHQRRSREPKQPPDDHQTISQGRRLAICINIKARAKGIYPIRNILRTRVDPGA